MHLLKYFKEFSVHPKNAVELRGLILQLAIQGKLTTNWRRENPDVEPAPILLERIQKEKSKLIKEKKIKKEKSLSQISEEEIPFKISKTWIWTRLGEIGSTNVGLTYKPAHINNSGVPVLRSSNIQEGELCLKDLVRVNTDYREKDIIKEGDLLICARNGSRRLVGKCTIIGQINEAMVFGAFMAIFRSEFNPYLQLFIQSPQYREKLDGVETTTINQITQGNLKETTVPLPPLEEQKAIVDVVNQLFVEVEQLEALTKQRIELKSDFVNSALRKLTTGDTEKEWAYLQPHFATFFTEKPNVKKLRESILQLAVQGNLTADWRKQRSRSGVEVEDAAVLLECIKAEKEKLVNAKKIKKEKPLPEITEDEIPYELPEGWVWCRFQEVGNIASNLVHPEDYLEYPHIAPNVIEKNIGILLPYKSIGEDKVVSFKHLFKPGQILYSKIRPNLNKLVKVDFEGLCSADMYPIDSYIYKDYLFYFMLSAAFLVQSVKTDTRVAMPKINQTELNKIIISVPPFKEQKIIVEKINALMGLCDELKQQIETCKATQENWMKSALREVFES